MICPKEIRVVTVINMKELDELIEKVVEYVERKHLVPHAGWMDSTFPIIMRSLQRRHHLLAGVDLPGVSQHFGFWMFARNEFRKKRYEFLKKNHPLKFKEEYDKLPSGSLRRLLKKRSYSRRPK